MTNKVREQLKNSPWAKEDASLARSAPGIRGRGLMVDGQPIVAPTGTNAITGAPKKVEDRFSGKTISTR